MTYDDAVERLVCDHDGCAAEVDHRAVMGAQLPDGWVLDTRQAPDRPGLAEVRHYCRDHAWRATAPL